MSNVEYVARDAVAEWLNDGMEFCYIYERDDTADFTQEQLELAHRVANSIIIKLQRQIEGHD